MSDLVSLTDGAIERIWFDPPNNGRLPVLLIECHGPKPYKRIWLDDPALDLGSRLWAADWTHFRSTDAVLIAGDPE